LVAIAGLSLSYWPYFEVMGGIFKPAASRAKAPGGMRGGMDGGKNWIITLFTVTGILGMGKLTGRKEAKRGQVLGLLEAGAISPFF